MTAVFSPAIALLNRLGFKAKFAVIFASVLLPLAILASLALQSVNADVRLLRNEANGVELLTTLRTPLERLQEHRALMITLLTAPSEALRTSITQLRPQIDAQIAELSEVAGRLEADADIGNRIRTISNDWASIKSMDAAVAGVNFAAHSALINELIELGVYASDYFELSLSS